MKNRYSDTARMIEFGLEMGGRIGALLGEAIPEEAKAHLHNAQRELLTAAFLIYQNQAMGRRSGFEREVPEPGGSRTVRRRTAGPAMAAPDGPKPRARKRPAATSVRIDVE